MVPTKTNNNNNNQNINFDINESNESNESNEYEKKHDAQDNDNEELETLLKEIKDTQLNYYLLYDNNSNKFNNFEFSSDNESKILSKCMAYELEYNVKQLTRICEYYGISKEIKMNKLKKTDIIDFLIDFEENIENIEIVFKRQQLWYFMSELKNDKFMKKYVIW